MELGYPGAKRTHLSAKRRTRPPSASRPGPHHRVAGPLVGVEVVQRQSSRGVALGGCAEPSELGALLVALLAGRALAGREQGRGSGRGAERGAKGVHEAVGRRADAGIVHKLGLRHGRRTACRGGHHRAAAGRAVRAPAAAAGTVAHRAVVDARDAVTGVVAHTGGAAGHARRYCAKRATALRADYRRILGVARKDVRAWVRNRADRCEATFALLRGAAWRPPHRGARSGGAPARKASSSRKPSIRSRSADRANGSRAR